jgi:2-polyprenyl-3-methyl-5-hydroxy-6-metoxy-1,4-benzoquinol methylase
MPRPDTDAIYRLIYKNGDKVPGYNRYWKYYTEIINQRDPVTYLTNSEPAYWSFVHALKNILNVSKEAAILELGSGLGYMVYALRKDGYSNVFGLDIAQEAVERAKRFGEFYICEDMYKYAQKTSQKYDVIFMTEVIEHVEDPQKLIKCLIPLLKDGGTLLMTTPDKSIYPDHVIWATERPPVHCWWFSEMSFRFLAQYFNMNISFVDFTKYYTIHKRELINMKLDEMLFNSYIFDKDNQVKEIQGIKSLKSFRILPEWLKKTCLYRKISPVILPVLSKSIKKVDRKKSTTMCILLTLLRSEKNRDIV